MSQALTFGLDKNISTVSTTLDSRVLGDYLRPILPSSWKPLEAIELHVLKHHPGKRCTLEITLHTATGTHELIGKAYAIDRPEVYGAMDAIVRAGFGPEEEFSIPQPLAYLSSMRLLVYEKVHGKRAKEIFLAGNPQSCASVAERCALWLARFHATEPKSQRIETLADQLILLEQRALRIAHLGYPLEAKARRLYELLENTASTQNIERCSGHSSFSSGQVILAGRRTIVIDWDGYDVADPARDVARFIIELRRLAHYHFGSIEALDAVGELFLQAYLSARGLKTLVQLPYHEAATCLAIAGRFVHTQPRSWFTKVEALVDEGLRILEREHQC